LKLHCAYNIHRRDVRQRETFPKRGEPPYVARLANGGGRDPHACASTAEIMRANCTGLPSTNLAAIRMNFAIAAREYMARRPSELRLLLIGHFAV
jgi:hypothetical protein